MFINEDKHKNAALSVRHWLTRSQNESGLVMNVVQGDGSPGGSIRLQAKDVTGPAHCKIRLFNLTI